MDWVEIVSALALVMFIVVMFPAARYMIKNSPRGTTSDWLGFVVPLVAVVLFIILLVKLV